MKIGGLRENPTPAGVPVAIKSPGESGMNAEIYEMMSATLNTISWVLPF